MKRFLSRSLAVFTVFSILSVYLLNLSPVMLKAGAADTVQTTDYYNGFDSTGNLSDFTVANPSDGSGYFLGTAGSPQDGYLYPHNVNISDSGYWPKSYAVLNRVYKDFTFETSVQLGYGQTWFQVRKTTADASYDTAGSGLSLMLDKNSKSVYLYFDGTVIANADDADFNSELEDSLSKQPGSFTDVKINAVGNTYTVFINDVLVAQYVDAGSSNQEGYCGFMANAADNNLIDWVSVKPYPQADAEPYAAAFNVGSSLSDFSILNASSTSGYSLGTSSFATGSLNPTNSTASTGDQWPKSYAVLNKTWKDFTFETSVELGWDQTWFQIRKTVDNASFTDAGSGFDLMLGKDDKVVYVYLNGTCISGDTKPNAAWNSALASALSANRGAFTDIKITAVQNAYTVYVNGLQILQYTDTAASPLVQGKCAVMANGADNNMVDWFCVTPILPSIASVTNPTDITVIKGTALSSVTLPAAVTVTDTNGSQHSLPVTWDTSSYDGSTTGTYTFAGTINPGDGDYVKNTLSPKTAALNVVVKQAQQKNIVSVDPVSPVTVSWGTALSAVSLPATVTARDSDGAGYACPVTWNCDNYNGTVAGSYPFTGALTIPGNVVTNTNDLTATVTVTVNADYQTTTTVTYCFDSIADLSDFDSYYLADSSNQKGVACNASTQWKVQNGELTRKGTFVSSDGTNKIAMLTYKGRKFKNFEVDVDETMGASTYWWPVVAFRQQTPGTYFMYDGAGAFVQQDGTPTFWGGKGFPTPNQGAAIAGYDCTAKHHMKLVVVGQDAKLYVDGTLANEMTLPSEDGGSGYISLMSVNNDSSFDNFSITNLDDNGHPTALAKKIVSVASVGETDVNLGTTKADVISSLPQNVSVTDEQQGSETCSVTWDCGNYNAGVSGTYLFTGTLLMPNGMVANPDNKQATAVVKVSKYTTAEKVSSVTTVTKTSVAWGTAKSAVKLPSTVAVKGSRGDIFSCPVTWDSQTYNSNKAGNYLFTGTLSMPGNTLTNPDHITASATVTVKPDYDAATTVKFYFNNASDLSAFSSFYLEKSADQKGAACAASSQWSIKNGKLVRAGSFTSDDGTNKIAILSYKARTYQNFEVNVDYTMGASTYWWPVVAFRQQVPGTYFMFDGAGAFVQQDGTPTFWGNGFGAAASGTAVSGYDRTVQHHMKLDVVGQSAKMYLDGSLAYHMTLPAQESAAGYISLMSVNNDSSFDNFSITNLDATGNPKAITTGSSPASDVTNVDTSDSSTPLFLTLIAALSCGFLVVDLKRRKVLFR